MIAVDIGANSGYYTILFANNVGDAGHVLAVEPNPHAAGLLQRSVEINGYTGRTRVEKVACSDGSSTRARLIVPPTEPKNAHIVPDCGPLDAESLETSCVTVDALCDGYDRVDFIKIDAEGSEERIFAGMARVLMRCRPIIVIEINIARYSDPVDFIGRLRAVYGELSYVSYDGHAVPITEDELLTRNVGQDWLVVLCPHKPF
jgi:FkbM family methyltransferase